MDWIATFFQSYIGKFVEAAVEKGARAAVLWTNLADQISEVRMPQVFVVLGDGIESLLFTDIRVEKGQNGLLGHNGRVEEGQRRGGAGARLGGEVRREEGADDHSHGDIGF